MSHGGAKFQAVTPCSGRFIGEKQLFLIVFQLASLRTKRLVSNRGIGFPMQGTHVVQGSSLVSLRGALPRAIEFLGVKASHPT